MGDKNTAPDWQEIKDYFTKTDRDHMLDETNGSLDLHNCESVLSNAAIIHRKVKSGTMPPRPIPAWTTEKVENFYNWWKSNPKCP